ncbi:MAG: tetratricopeptide repeat protein [Dysgonamonadaceae bacterium]|jgi:tetratricopeptide (TPR) repeat protein|nr:tetratricopeptide repeat protein [Dysgonamonadaceae bacterium]
MQHDDTRLSRIEILIQQKKYAEAERILKVLLAEDANDVNCLYLLAEVNLQQDKLDAAESIIDSAIGLSPDTALLFYVKSRIAILQDNYDEAEKNIGQSIALDANDADYFALFANIKLSRKQYKQALELSDKALEIDPENLLGLNTRSSVLLKLKRSEESFDTIQGALREDPNNAYTHANYGWGLLEKGERKKALEHFKESLKNNPNYSYAQAGMLEALKASNPIYNAFLKYALWINSLTAKYQWIVIIAFYLGMRILSTIAKTNKALQPYLTPLIFALAFIAFSTWIITPLSNLFLRFNPYGQFLLDKKKKMSSNFVAGALLIFVAGVLSYFIFSDEKFLFVAVFGFAMMPPFSVMFSNSKPKNALLFYAIAMAVVGIVAIGQTFSTGTLFNLTTIIFILGFFLFQWVANFLFIKKSNK